MPSVSVKAKKTVRNKRKPKAKPMTKLEMVQKMLADQKVIREAIQNGIPLEQLKKTHGLTFATLPDPKN
jgi:hypothetical protein